jgi:hypothetical protein
MTGEFNALPGLSTQPYSSFDKNFKEISPDTIHPRMVIVTVLKKKNARLVINGPGTREIVNS